MRSRGALPGRTAPGLAALIGWALVAAAVACQRPPSDLTAGLSCPIGIERGACVSLPDDFALQDCTLFRGEEDGVGPPHGSGDWGETPSGSGAGPCRPGQLWLTGLGEASALGQRSVLLCSARGQRCPAARQSTLVQCGRRPGGLSASLGPAVTSASMASHQGQLAAAWGQQPDDQGAVDLAFGLLDESLTAVPGAPLEAPSPCLNVARDGLVRRTTAHSAPFFTASGPRVLATGLCSAGALSQPLFQNVSFNGTAVAGAAVCPDLRTSVVAMDAVPVGGDEAVLALTVGCSSLPGAVTPECPGSGVLLVRADLQPRAGAGPGCDTDQQPLVLPPLESQVAWVGLGTVPITPTEGASSRALLAATLYRSDSGQARVVARLHEAGSPARSFDVLSSARMGVVAGSAGVPVMATGPGGAVLVTADPLSGVVASRLYYAAERQIWRQDDTALVAADDSVDGPESAAGSQPILPSVAVEPGAERADSFAICYGAHQGIRVVRVENGMPLTPEPVGAPGYGTGELPCAIAAAPAPGRYQVLYVIEDCPFASALPGAALSPLGGFDEVRGDLGRLQDAQLVPVADGQYVALLGDVQGRTLALLLSGDAERPRVLGELLRLAPESWRQRPVLRADAAGAFLVRTVPDGVGGSRLVHLRIWPAGEEQVLLAGPQVVLGDAVPLDPDGSETGLALAHGGPYLSADGSADSGRESAWVRPAGLEGPLHRLVPRDPVEAGPASLLLAGDGTGLVAVGPSQSRPGPLELVLSSVPGSSDLATGITFLGQRRDVSGVHLVRSGGDGSLLSLYTTLGDPVPYLVRLAGPQDEPLSAPVALGAAGAGDAELRAPRLIELSPGLLAVTACQRSGSGWTRWLVPTDDAGQPLGPRIELGWQRRTADPPGEAPRCPPASIIAHGQGWLSSSVTGDGTGVIEELTCDEET